MERGLLVADDGSSEGGWKAGWGGIYVVHLASSCPWSYSEEPDFFSVIV